MFYLPSDVDYIAVMRPGPGLDERARREKTLLNERLILESVGRASAQGSSSDLRGRVRQRTQDLPPKSVDCVLSVCGLEREPPQSAFEAVNEAYRCVFDRNLPY